MHNPEFIRLFDNALEVGEKIKVSYDAPIIKEYNENLFNGLIRAMAGYKSINEEKIRMSLENVRRILEEF